MFGLSHLEQMAIGGENGESCKKPAVRITEGRDISQIRTSVVGPRHNDMLVVV